MSTRWPFGWTAGTSASNLARTYQDACRLDEASTCFQHTLAVIRRAFGDDHAMMTALRRAVASPPSQLR